MKIIKKQYWKNLYKSIINTLFPKEDNLIITSSYIISLFMGLLFSFFTVNDYLDNEYILENGIEVKAVLIDKEYRNKMTISSIEYQDKVYHWGKYGVPYDIGDSVMVLYSPDKDMFLPINHDKEYVLIFMWFFFIFFGGTNIIRVLYIKIKTVLF
ncbi:hypothetical protein WAF17_03795 [Bernardetia sp. ABR2-2B]|uniref:hypothetical protein n=1 Tax=Bernardetia sp. ABR2-2B TaxID=3127472 RepID=UPI0030CEF359